ncbi:MAG: MiaB/RimO family radical SAM methylthiotransferase, partial [Mesorhizobium sp.]
MSAPRVSFVSLGCPKALVDSERIITRLRAEGYEIARKHDGADLVVVNTCGFLDSARDESLDAIGSALSENGRVIVTGCLGAEPEVIREKHPNVLAITGPQAYESVMAAVHEAAPPSHDPYIDLLPPQGVKLTPRHYAYLKISEGCNNRCTFCIIPYGRGNSRSVPMGAVVEQVKRLAANGYAEIVLTGVDMTSFGADLPGSPKLGKLVKTILRQVPEVKRLRLSSIDSIEADDELLDAIATEPRLMPHLHLSLQSGDDMILKRMKRRHLRDQSIRFCEDVRKLRPGIVFGADIIAGFPTETEAMFKNSEKIVEECGLTHLHV